MVKIYGSRKKKSLLFEPAMQQELACRKALCKATLFCVLASAASKSDGLAKRFAMPGCNQTFGLYFILKND